MEEALVKVPLVTFYYRKFSRILAFRGTPNPW